MNKVATENLFLIEFLVDRIALDPSCMCSAPPCNTCISFQFLDNEPLNVCEEDFLPKTPYTRENRTLKSGKSCLFSLTPEQAETAVDDFDVCVNVFKKMPEGWLPEKVEIGGTVISIAELFTELIDAVSNSDGNTPSSKTLKDVFDVLNDNEEVIGKISVYVRLSCFGKLIVTQFQMNTLDKSVLFRDGEGKSLYRYKKADQGKNCAMGTNILCPEQACEHSSGGANYNNISPVPPSGGMGGFPSGGMGGLLSGGMGGMIGSNGCMPNCPLMGNMVPCNECGGLQPCGPQPPPCGYPCAPPPPCAPPAPCAPPPPGNYQEIGASMGNNSLTIRVHKDNKVETVSNEAGPACGMKSPACTEQNLMMSPGVQQGNTHHPFNMKVGNCGPAPGNNNVVVNSPVCTAPDGTQFTEISDPDKELFLLRIGKKSEGVNKKANLELELCTPKAPPFKPRPKKETRDTQYDEKDAGKDKGKKDKKSKKDGKAKKKK